MFKLIDGNSFFKSSEESKATLLFEDGVGTGLGLTKQAAALEIDEFVKNISPREGFFYVHINAMGAGEYYGANRNGDYFPEAQLIAHHKTFETNPAHVFRHHVNKDPEKSIGKVVYAYYNPRMHRVELIAEIDKELGRDEYIRIQRGEFPLTSMACKTPYDRCSICGNQATHILKYCVHLKEQVNQILPDGRKVMAYNIAPLSFFDISIVIRPADITSSVLQKVANEMYIGSAFEADAAGVTYDKNAILSMSKQAAIKKASIQKAADLIKQIDGEVISAPVASAIDAIEDPSTSLLNKIIVFTMEEILNGFAELGMNPSMEFMSSLILAKFAGVEHAHLGEHAVKLFLEQSELELPEESSALIPDVGECPAPPELLKLLFSYVQGSSYSPEMVEKRASVGYSVPGDGPRDGYTNWGIGRSNTTLDRVPHVPVERSELLPEIAKLLFTVAGGALIAKYMISSLARMKMVKADSNWLKSSVGQSPLMKSAEITPMLMELSMIRRLSNVRK